jgi:phosphate transport system substrate-binding protein
MMQKWAEEYKKVNDQVQFDISAGGAGKGMADALGGMVDIGMVSREIYAAEIENGAFWVSVTKDAVVPVVNEDNPCLEELLATGATRQTFADIWATGEVTDWSELTSAGQGEHSLNVYTRSDACGAAQTWAQYLGDYNQEDLLGTAVYGDPGLAEAVKKDSLGIGFNNLNYAYDMETGEPIAGLRVIPIDVNENGQVDADEDFYSNKAGLTQAIAEAKYPSPPARDLHLVAKGQFTGITKDFVEWVLTEGQQYVGEVGYIALGSEKISQQLEKLGD